MDSDASESYEHLFNATDIDTDSSKHDKLVEKLLKLNKQQKLKKPSRTEATLEISEFNLTKTATGQQDPVVISNLTKSLKKKKNREKLNEHVRRLHKNAQTLPKPLEQPQAARIRRGFGYEKTRLQLDRWEATVTANRVSTNMSFPLNNDYKMDKKESEQFTNMWRVKSKLKEELEKLEPKVEEFRIDLEQEKFPLTMKEMLTRRKEMGKLKAYQRNKEAKARRESKIKSKKYHRIKKKEKIKQKLKEFEQLQKTDPEAALKKLEDIEKTRVEERFSLRHKGTGKWARNQQIRAKYDKETRQTLAQQLKLSRDLTQKAEVNESSSDDEKELENISTVVDEDNPWVSGIKPGKEVTDFLGGYRKYWLEQNKNSESTESVEKENPEEATDEQPKKKTKRSVSENETKKLTKKKEQVTVNSSSKKVKKVKSKTKRQEIEKSDDKLTSPEPSIIVQPEPIIIVQSEPIVQTPAPTYPKPQVTMLNTAIPDIATNEDMDDEQRALICEAFEDDDIVADFHKDKKSEIDKDKPKDINLALPGWGSWASANNKVSRRKKRRFTLKAHKQVRRRDENKGFLIINESAQSKIKEHLVSEVPFPFKTVKDFEASVRAPIGNTFVPETAFRRLIKPTVSTQMGKIISPIDKDILINK